MPVVASAQPSTTSPLATVVLKAVLTSTISGTKSGRPFAGGAHAHVLRHAPLGHPATSGPSHASAPSRMPFPQTLGGETVNV